MEKLDEIFVNQPSQENQKSDSQIKYIHNTESADYITQFLLDEGQHDFFKGSHDSAPMQLEQIKQKKEEDEDGMETFKSQHKRQKSLFHNFQKHLVITLKNIVKIKQIESNDLVSHIASEMWQIFLKSHLYTKTILHILYGAEGEQQECSFTSTMLNKFGYVDLFNKYTEEMIRQAQLYLRRQTVKAIKKVNVKHYLSRRRMSKAEQFQEYLNEFVDELSQGPIKRRIPKGKKKNLKSYQNKIKASQPVKKVKKHDDKMTHQKSYQVKKQQLSYEQVSL